MDLAVQMKALGLIGRLLKQQTEHVSYVTYEPQKIAFPGYTEGVWHFPRSTPEEQGISSAWLERFFRDMAGQEDVDAHSILIVRNGHIIASGSFAPFREDLWHISHSMCKSVTGLAVGMLVAEGKLRLDEKLTDIFSEDAPWLTPSLWHKGIKVEHLLTMSSGVIFNETGAATEDDWVRCYLESGREFEPGEKFSYNSMNTMMLSAIVQERSGQNLMEYLTPRLWEPLGIRNVYWEMSPTGIVKGGWGLNLCIEDMAKLGQLYLNGGMWERRRIVPQEWLIASSQKHIDSDPAMSPYGYGYQVWRGKLDGAYHFNGMLGQNVFIMPQYEMIVATTAGSSEIFGTGRLTELVYRYFQSEEFHPAKEPLAQNPPALRSLEMTLASLRFHTPCKETRGASAGGWYQKGPSVCGSRHPLSPIVRHERRKRETSDPDGLRADAEQLLEQLSGAVFTMEKNAAGILPLFVQMLHNNYTNGISEIEFCRHKEKLELIFREGEDENRVEVGFSGPGRSPGQMGRGAESMVTIHGEPYAVGTCGAWKRLESGAPELQLELCFLETSNTRVIRMHLEDGMLHAEFDEYPVLTRMLAGLEPMIAGGKESGGPARLFRELDFTKVLMSRTLSPQIKGQRKDSGE